MHLADLVFLVCRFAFVRPNGKLDMTALAAQNHAFNAVAKEDMRNTAKKDETDKRRTSKRKSTIQLALRGWNSRPNTGPAFLRKPHMLSNDGAGLVWTHHLFASIERKFDYQTASPPRSAEICAARLGQL